MTTSPIDFNASASTGSAGARTPSSLLIRMRNGRGCWAAAAATRYTAAIAVPTTRNRLGRLLGCRGNIVKHETALHLFHRNPLGLEGMRAVLFGFAVVVVEPWKRAAAQLFGA